ncbi:MAG: sigma-54 dependent transcriptional regulator [Anaerovoracaceae bacterium]|nr:sigma-54-dependent Fis family transcriptional regulator [Bacillota bacterium]MEE0516644.1 sigma-54 dependent transcriptional regulator [Anaerovoracaceae bacterium]
MEIGYFALEKNKKFIYTDESTIRFARNNRTDVQWHSNGKIQINDIVIYVGKYAKEAGIYEAAGLKEDSAFGKGAMEAVIFRYEDGDFLPFYKHFDNESFGETETIYSGESIKIQFEKIGECTKLIVSVGNAWREESSMSPDGNIMVVKNGIINFFSKEHNVSKELKELIKHGVYDAYISKKGPWEATDFFEKNVGELITEMNENSEPLFFDSYGKPVVLKWVAGEEITGGMSVFSIGEEAAYLEHIRKETEIYDKLYFDDRIKIGKNELGCEARLKGCGENIEYINNKLDKVCRKNVTIVLTGESGTGKTFLAGEIHRNSRRADGPFINVNCAAIAYNLIESELFGYEEGAFTGARKGGKIGYFEMARGGTLFLDEISELPYLLQGKLLEVLQEGTFYRVGGIRKISADVRLIVATNKDLEKMVKAGQFREDLYYRINVFPIQLPPLRERISDLESIVGDTLPLICERLETDNLMLTNQALEKMKQYSWPGNIRELENVLEKAAVMAEGSFIREEDIVLDNPVAKNKLLVTLKDKMEAYEKEIVKQTFLQFNRNRRKTAEALGISKTNLFDKLHKYDIEESEE